MPAKLFIKEWMETKPGLDQQKLAKLMHTTPGTITKKLQEPERIDLKWMELFAFGLALDHVTDLFRHPNQPREVDLALADLLRAWPDLNDAEKANIHNTIKIFASRRGA